MSPQRIQMSRQRPWRAEHPDAVIVARPSPFSNPWRVVPDGRFMGVNLWRVAGPDGGPIPGRFNGGEMELYDARALAVELFRERTMPTLDLSLLAGHDLACWCRPPGPCHVDPLLIAANRTGHAARFGPDSEPETAPDLHGNALAKDAE